MHQILNSKFYNSSAFELQKYMLSHFELKKKKRVRFWFEKNTKRWILNENFQDASDVELKNLQRLILN